ncbi:hypothetical protein AAG906_007493 [Vitis piasezkii]
MRSLQPRFARHLMGFPHTDFGSLVQALYGIEEGIARGLWSESSPTDSKGKKPSGGQRSGDVGAISSAGMRPPRHYQTATLGFYYPPSPHAPYSRSFRTYDSHLSTSSLTLLFLHTPQRPLAPYTQPRAPCTTTYVQRPPRRLPIDLIDQGLVNLGQPSVTTNPLPAHSTHAMPPSPGDIHYIHLIEDDSIHMLSWDDGLPKPIVLHDSYEVDGVSVVPQAPTPFNLIRTRCHSS